MRERVKLTVVTLLICFICRQKEATNFFTVPEVLNNDILPDIEISEENSFDEEFDEEFDDIIKTINLQGNQIEIPEDLNLNMITEKLITDEVLTPFQYNTNCILNNLDRLKYLNFCQGEYYKIMSLIETLKFEGPVKAKDLGQFYSSIHEHLNSAEFLLSCMLLFENEAFTAEHKHICFNISVEIRKYILKKKAEVYPSSEKNLSQ